jgi:hypothetical protein
VDVNPLSDELLAKIFFHSVGWLFTLIVAFAIQKLLIWCNPISQFLLLFPELIESCSGNSCLCLYLEVISLFFPQYFQFFKCYIKVFSPFWIDFSAGWETFSLGLVDIYFSQHHLLKKRLGVFPNIVFGTFVENQMAMWDNFLFFYSIPLVYVCFCASATWSFLLWLWSIKYELRYCDTWSGLLWLFKVFCASLWIFGLFVLLLWGMSLGF